MNAAEKSPSQIRVRISKLKIKKARDRESVYFLAIYREDATENAFLQTCSKNYYIVFFIHGDSSITLHQTQRSKENELEREQKYRAGPRGLPGSFC